MVYKQKVSDEFSIREILMETILDGKTEGNVFYIMVGEKGLIINMGDMGEDEFFKIIPTDIKEEFEKRLVNRQKVDAQCTGMFNASTFGLSDITAFAKMKDIFFALKGTTKEMYNALNNLSEVTSINFLNDKAYNLNIFNDIPLENLDKLGKENKEKILKIADKTTIKFLNHKKIQPEEINGLIRIEEEVLFFALKNGLIIHENTSFDNIFKNCKKLRKERVLPGLLNLDFNEELYLKDKERHDKYLSKIRQEIGDEYVRVLVNKLRYLVNQVSLQKEIILSALTLEDLHNSKEIFRENYEKVLKEYEVNKNQGEDFDLIAEVERIQKVDYVFLFNNLLKINKSLDIKELLGTYNEIFIRRVMLEVFETKYKDKYKMDVMFGERKIFLSIKGDALYEDKGFLNELIIYLVNHVTENKIVFKNHLKLEDEEKLMLSGAAKEFLLRNSMKNVKKEDVKSDKKAKI